MGRDHCWSLVKMGEEKGRQGAALWVVDLLPGSGGGWPRSAERKSGEMMVEVHVLWVPPIH